MSLDPYADRFSELDAALEAARALPDHCIDCARPLRGSQRQAGRCLPCLGGDEDPYLRPDAEVVGHPAWHAAREKQRAAQERLAARARRQAGGAG